MRISKFVLVLCLASIRSVVATNISYDGGFNRTQCYARTLAHLANGTLDPNDDIFFRDANGHPMSDEDNVTLTLPGCHRMCGPQQAWYFDIGPRLSVWLIPILILLSNLELSPLDKRRFTAILHVVGDPIDSIWSLVHKIDSWDRCYSIAEGMQDYCADCQRVIATVFAGFEELYGPDIKTEAYFSTLTSNYQLATQFNEWRRTAVKLADSRTDEFLRTCLAILLYAFQLVSGFVKEVGGGNSSAPGGRIATGVFLSWLIPTVLLSNVIGNYPSRRTCYDVLLDFAHRTHFSLHTPHARSVFLPNTPYIGRRSLDTYFQSLSWRGALHAFRPWKTQYTTWQRSWPRTALAIFVSLSPVCIGMIGGFVILWYSLPLGFNCRHGWLISIFLLWIISAVITWLSNSEKLATGKYHWRLVLVKDAVIATPSILIIFLSACGLFNSCNCWSGLYYYGPLRARVLLNTDPYYYAADDLTYPVVVGVSMAFQMITFTIIAVVWRRGLRLLRWGESAIHTEWERCRRAEADGNGGVCGCRSSVPVVSIQANPKQIPDVSVQAKDVKLQA